MLWYSDERTRTTILSVPQIFPVLTGHTVGPRNMYENGRYAELGGKKWYHGDSPSSVGLLASLSIYIEQMTKSWNSGDDQKERAATCQGSHTGQGSPAPRPQTGAGTRYPEETRERGISDHYQGVRGSDGDPNEKGAVTV